MTVTLEKEVEEPFEYKELFLMYLTVFTDYEVSEDRDIETGRGVLHYKETDVRYEITNIEDYEFEGYSLSEYKQKWIAEKCLDADTRMELQSFAEAHSGHKDGEIFEEAMRTA